MPASSSTLLTVFGYIIITVLCCYAPCCTLPPLHCIALYCIVLDCTASYCTVLHCTALHCSAPYLPPRTKRTDYAAFGRPTAQIIYRRQKVSTFTCTPCNWALSSTNPSPLRPNHSAPRCSHLRRGSVHLSHIPVGCRTTVQGIVALACNECCPESPSDLPNVCQSIYATVCFCMVMEQSAHSTKLTAKKMQVFESSPLHSF